MPYIIFCQLLDPGWYKGGHGTYNVDQDVKRLSLPLLHQLSRIMFRPLALLFFTKVPTKCFLAPWALHWVGYGCVRRDRLVFPWVLQELEPQDHHQHCSKPRSPIFGPLTSVKAPCPPILCPKMLTLSLSISLKFSNTVFGSSCVI